MSDSDTSNGPSDKYRGGERISHDDVSESLKAAEAASDARDEETIDLGAIDATAVSGLTRGDFDSAVGETFALHVDDGGSHQLKLVEVHDGGEGGEGDTRKAFLAVFEGADGSAPEVEGTFQVSHETLGDLHLYLTPVHAVAGDHPAQLEAVFT